jgi:Flp pilus assembly protein TadG
VHDERRPDHGAVSVFLVMATTIVVMFIGVAVDLSGKLHALQRAQDVARQAARAAAQAAGPTAVKGLAPSSRAVQAGQAYLAAAGVPGSVTISGGTVTVTAVATYDPVILSIAGLGTQSVTGQSTAQLTRAAQGVAR